MHHSLFYGWKHQLQPFGLGGAVKPGEEEGQQINQLITLVSLEQLLALPGSADNMRM